MNFDQIQTSRLIVRRLVPEDAEAMTFIRSHPQVTRFQFAVELKAESRLIGDIGFLNSDENKKSWIGFTLNPDYWNKGFGTEAVRAVLGYYTTHGISEVRASTDPENHTSMKLLRAVGFQLIETKPNDMVFHWIKGD